MPGSPAFLSKRLGEKRDGGGSSLSKPLATRDLIDSTSS